MIEGTPEQREATMRRYYHENHANSLHHVDVVEGYAGPGSPLHEQSLEDEKEDAALDRAMKKRGQKKSLSELRAKYLGKAAPVPPKGAVVGVYRRRQDGSGMPARMVEPLMRDFGYPDRSSERFHLLEDEEGTFITHHSGLTGPDPDPDVERQDAEDEAEEQQKGLPQPIDWDSGVPVHDFHPDVLHMAHQVAQGHGDTPEDWDGKTDHVADDSAHGPFMEALKEHGHDEHVAHAKEHGIPAAAHRVITEHVLPKIPKGTPMRLINRHTGDEQWVFCGGVCGPTHPDGTQHVFFGRRSGADRDTSGSAPVSSRHYFVAPIET